MKNNKVKAKKGMTLIEVIISVALLSILMVPISSLVMSSLKNNIDAEDMQKASYIGQKVLEELKAYDEIKLEEESNEKYFNLLDGDSIVKKDEEFLGSFDRNIYGNPSNGKDKDTYRVDVKVEKDANFQYENINNRDKNNSASFKLNFTNDNNIKDPLGFSYSISNKLIMEIEKDSKILTLYNESNPTNKLTISKANTNNNIIFYIEDKFSKDVNIEFKNKTEETIEIHMIKENSNFLGMKIYSSSGNTILYEENAEEENKIGDMYNYTVTVMDKKNNILFQGMSNNNVNIE